MLETTDPRHQPPLESGMEDEGGDTASAPTPALHPEDVEWLAIARDSFSSGQRWFDSSMRSTLERALANFRGVHPPGSKYNTEQYQKKSHLFRPKTRSAIRRGEAGHAIAFFSTQDVVHCSPVNESDPQQVLAADVHNALLNTRLNDPRQHWFRTLIGGCQDAMAVGTVVSKQCWDFEQVQVEVEDEYEDGFDFAERPIKTTLRRTEHRVLVDRPLCKLLPIENVFIDPAADWTDPINSSPYVIELQPTYVYQVEAKIASGKYREVGRDIMSAASAQDWDSVRRARDGERINKYDHDNAVSEYTTVWVHHNIVHRNGQDWVYDTLGSEIMLMDPVPIEDYYKHSKTYDRPYVMGCSIMEAHKNYPGGIAQLIESLQEEANDVVNLRLDNVKHAINPKWIVRRGSGIDVRSLIRNIPSSVTYTSNIQGDIRELRAADVTGSAYAEQDRINMDIDDVVGTFSGSSVAGNRRVNETVGGMNMLANDANRLEEFMIRTVAETWVEPVMRQLVALEAAYESDEKILQVVASRTKNDMDAVMQAITVPVNVRCNVGFNATNPQKRIEKLNLGLGTIANFSPETMQGIDVKEVMKEVFGAVGYKDGSRFFPQLYNDEQGDPQVQQLQQQVQQLQQMLQGKVLENQTKMQIAKLQSDTRLTEAGMKQQIEELKLRQQGVLTGLQAQIDQLDAEIRAADSDRKRKELFLQREALSQSVLESNRNFDLEVAKLEREESHRVEDRTLMPPPPTSGAMNLAGNDKAGVLSRDRYGMIPQAGG